MKLLPALAVCLIAGTAGAVDVEDLIDRLDRTLTISAFHDNLRARLSGTFDLEFYHFEQPAPGLIDSHTDTILNPRLTLFLDTQLGEQLYFFGQARLDRGFDPSDHGAQVRFDEYALRYTPWKDGRFNIQIGQFATVIGNWIPRHLSWENPFVNAPLPYNNITAVSDKSAPGSAAAFIRGFDPNEKYEFNPVIWGPDYAGGVSVSGRVGQFDYVAEMKNTALSARPQSWPVTSTGFGQPTLSGRVGYRPSESWNLGLSISDGAYFRHEAERTLPLGRDIDDYHEMVLGQDVSFAWHHLQLWAEFYEARFEVPHAGNADTFAYYLEAKYKFTPQLFGAVRWNQQLFNEIDTVGRWSQDLGRVDVAAGYRFTAHSQLKFQYGYQRESTGRHDENHLFAAQFTVRF